MTNFAKLNSVDKLYFPRTHLFAIGLYWHINETINYFQFNHVKLFTIQAAALLYVNLE